MRRQLGALTKKWKDPFYSGDPDMTTWSCQSVWLRNTHSLARHWQTHLPDAMTDSTSLLNEVHVQCQSGTGGSTVEKPVETQTSIQLVSHLVRAPQFEFPMRRELGSLTKSKSGKILGVRSFYMTLPRGNHRTAHLKGNRTIKNLVVLYIL